MNKNIISLLVFVTAYILFVALPRKRSLVAVAASLLLIATNTISIREAFWAVNWNVMGIFVGTLVVAAVFMESRVPAFIAELIVDRSKNTKWAVLMICLLTGFISAFVENVATVLIIAPIALALAKKIKMNPVNMMIAIAVTSNLQGTATLIGDPPSMLLGGFAKMSFMDFFFYKGRPSIFFAVELGAITSFLVLFFVFRREKHKIEIIPVEKIKTWVPTGILVALVLLLAFTSFLDTGFSYMAGALCMVAAVVSIIWDRFMNKKRILEGIKALDWDTTLFLAGVFILVGSLTLIGWIDIVANLLSQMISGNIFLGYTLLVFVSVVLSAFIDNVPFLAAMLPVAISMANNLGINPSLFLFGLLIGTSIGGNITPIGASANIVACGLLKKEGYEVKFKEFMKIGIPFTLAAVSAAYLFLWFIWSK